MRTTKLFGKYRGKVENNLDPYGLGRLQVSAPSALGDTSLAWALPCVPFAGKDVGLYLIPPVGANVWVEFEGGNIDAPIWSGCFWGIGEFPLTLPTTRVLKTVGTTLSISELPGGGVTLDVMPPAVVTPVSVKISTAGVEVKLGATTMTLTPTDAEIKTSASSAKLTATDITLGLAPSTVKLTPNDVSLGTGASSVKLTAADVTTANGPSSSKLTAASIEMGCAPGSVKISPSGVDLAAGATGTAKIAPDGVALASGPSSVKVTPASVDVASGPGKATIAAAGVEVTSGAGGAIKIVGPMVDVNGGALKVI